MGKGLQQGFHPHQLISDRHADPAHLAMTAYADLDTSTIDELPPGRTPGHDGRHSRHAPAAISLTACVNACMTEGRQAYWVCTLIEESELLEAQAAGSHVGRVEAGAAGAERGSGTTDG